MKSHLSTDCLTTLTKGLDDQDTANTETRLALFLSPNTEVT